MSFASTPRSPRPVLARRRRSPLVPTLVVLGVLVVLLALLAEIWTEVLWFRQLGFEGVFRTRIITQVALFVLGAGLMAGAVAVSLNLAYRSRPVYAPVNAEQQSLDRYRESLEPLRRLVMVVLPAGLGLFAGSAAAQQWDTVLLWRNSVPFGEVDPQFGMDISFFVFTLPFLRFTVGFLTAVVVLAGLAAAGTHYLYGGLRLQGEGDKTTPAARVHLAVVAGVLVLLQAGSYWLDRYSSLADPGNLESITGASYTGVNAVLPAKAILAGIAVICALLFFSTAFRGGWRLPGLGVVLLVVSAIAVGGIYPAAVQQFQVEPSQQERERPYIERNIEATRAAYSLDDVEVIPYAAAPEGERGALAEDARTTASIRLLDPALVSDSFRQLQQNRQYYNFPNNLDVDRYDIDGETRDTVIAVRELDLGGLPPAQRSWINDHTVYTHGYGVVAAYGNQRSDNGEPAFFQSGIPSVGELGDYEPRIYFGERSPQFSVVGAPESRAPQELDFPVDEEGGTGQANTTYTGDGGPSIGNFFTQMLYAIKFRDQNILLSNAVNDESQILYERDPRERVEKVAPFLTLDQDPYPAVVDGEVKWIIDGYTTTAAYPYSDLQPLGEVTTDSITAQTTATQALAQREINYIHNSVKATVDAYSGEVHLYAWNESDPLLQAWMKIFPGAVQPMSEIDGELMSHLRYPEDLFKVQREVLGSYHVQDSDAFYSGSDFWKNPDDPTTPDGVEAEAQPPYYLTLQMPGQETPSFSLTSSYIPRATEENVRNVLTGFVAVNADAGSTTGQPDEGYGTIRLLQLPRNATVAGPGQVQNDFNSDPSVSQALNLLRQGDSEVLSGNLLTLPVGGGLLYVQPVYVQSAGDTSYPLLQRVLVSFGGDIGFAETLDEALDQVFGGDSGADAGDAGAGGGGEETPPTETPGGEVVDPGAQARLAAALTDANQALQDGQAALAAGDFTAYGAAQEALADAIQQALEAEAEISGATPTEPPPTGGG